MKQLEIEIPPLLSKDDLNTSVKHVHERLDATGIHLSPKEVGDNILRNTSLQAERIEKAYGTLKQKEEGVDSLFEVLSSKVSGAMQLWVDLSASSDEILSDIRKKRMATEVEVANISNSVKRVVDLVGDTRFQEGVSKLEQLATVCERLQTLHQNGFLEKVTSSIK